MADPFSPDAFYGSAQAFALSALEAHHAGNHRRAPLDAGTALEHLAKACLARRSPALLAELKRDSGISSVIGLLRIEGAGVPSKIRTVGLSEALHRMERFARSKAAKEDLQTLVDMRDGIVHAAEDAEVEGRILTAFVQHADRLLTDLGRERGDFWNGQLTVVDALLKDASDKIAHRVEVRLAAAAAALERRYAADGETVLTALRALSRSASLAVDQRFHPCPVCDSYGIATGGHSVDWTPDDWDKETGEVTNARGEVWFTAQKFRCPVCNLRLDSGAEIEKAGIDTTWEIEDADWRDYEPQDWQDYDPRDDDDADYEHWREERNGK
jgi:hypothetical protein